jgi:ligand-binding SRPBCC domain-containing protein
MQTLEQKQQLPIGLQEAWEFFSNPANLKLITPPYMGFDILNESLPGKIYPGMIIHYRVKPLLSIPMKWVTEITQVDPMHYFIDNQKSGPYTYWHHQHFFREIKAGVEMVDIVNYKAPFGVFGRVAEKTIVAKKVAEIFEFRKGRLEQLFP